MGEELKVEKHSPFLSECPHSCVSVTLSTPLPSPYSSPPHPNCPFTTTPSVHLFPSLGSRTRPVLCKMELTGGGLQLLGEECSPVSLFPWMSQDPMMETWPWGRPPFGQESSQGLCLFLSPSEMSRVYLAFSPPPLFTDKGEVFFVYLFLVLVLPLPLCTLGFLNFLTSSVF